MVETAPLEVVAGVISQNNTFLLGQRGENSPHPLKWEFPGGKIEPNETPEEALNRELREELNLYENKITHLITVEHYYPEKKRNIELIFFRVKTDLSVLQNLIYKNIRFFNRNEIFSLDLLDADRKAIEIPLFWQRLEQSLL
jgi:8-oxo-dGTP diphosphatase